MTPPAPSSAAPLAANVMKPCWPQRCPTPPRRPRRAGPGVRRLPARNADRGEGHRYHDPRGRSSPQHRWRVAVLLAPVLAGFAVIALTYGALGLLLGVLVKGDLEGFFLIITGGLTDTFLQNPLGNPLANKPALEWFPSFGPMQFAVGGSLGHTALWSHLALSLAWTLAFALTGLAVLHLRTRTRRHAS